MLRELGRERIYIRSSKAALLTLVVVVSSLSFSGEIASTPPISGNWVVFGQESYSNTTIVLNGSLIITETGKLTLDNVTLIMNSTNDGEYRIQVNQSGVLVMNNTRVKPYDTAFTYGFEVYGNLFFNHSTAEDPYGLPFSPGHKGGIQVYGGNLTMNHSKVTRSRANGVHLVQANATLSNCEISFSFVDELHLFQSDFVNVTSCNLTDTGSWVGYGIFLGDSKNFSLEDSEVRNHYGYGIFARWSPGLRINNSEISGINGPGADITDSDNSTISNSTFDDNFAEDVFFQNSKDIRLDSNLVMNSAGGIFLYDSIAFLHNNTAINHITDGFYLRNSDAVFIGNSDPTVPGGSSLSSKFSNMTFLGDVFSGAIEFENSTARARRLLASHLYSESSDIHLINSTLRSSVPFALGWGSHATLLNTTVLKWEIFYVDYVKWNVTNPSVLIVKNFLNIRTRNETDGPLSGTDILVEEDGREIYASPGFGGTDLVSDADGESNWIVVTDRIYLRDHQTPGHPFKNITYNTTSVSVSKSAYKFGNNPREVEMNESHTEVFTAVPPSPPSNLTARLSGNDYENVTLQWTVSPDEGNESSFVTDYHIFRGNKYQKKGTSYQFVGSVMNGTNEFVDVGKGEVDPNSYFYFVCAANSRNFSNCSPNQAGKFSRNLSASVQLVSIPLIPENRNLSEVFKTVEYDKVWTYSNGEENPWRSYHSGKIANDLSELNRSMGIWINVTIEDRLVVAGIVPIETRIALHPGWNLVGFPSFNETYSMSDLVLQTGAISAEGYNPLASPYFLRKLGDGETLNAGEAYWIRMPGEALWIIAN